MAWVLRCPRGGGRCRVSTNSTPEQPEKSGVYYMRSDQVAAWKTFTQMGRALKVWGSILIAAIVGLLLAGVQFGRLATTAQVQAIHDELIRLEVKVDAIEKRVEHSTK